MSGLNLDQKPKTQRPVPAQGSHAARCFQVIELGTHNKPFKGVDKWQKLVQLGFEIPSQMAVFDEKRGPQPCAVFQEYTVSSGDKANLVKMLKSWLMKPQLAPDELRNLVGKEAQITVIHNKAKTPDLPLPASMYGDGYVVYANLNTISPAIPQVPAGPMINPPMLFELDNFTWTQFHSLPEFICKKIRASQEWSGVIARMGQEPARPQQQAAPQQQQYQQPQQQVYQQPVTPQQAYPVQQPIQQQPVYQQPQQPMNYGTPGQMQGQQQFQNPNVVQTPGMVQNPLVATRPLPAGAVAWNNMGQPIDQNGHIIEDGLPF